MKGYWIIFGSAVIDIEAQEGYGRLWAPIADKYGAKLRRLSDESKLEVREDSRVFAVEFPSYEQAKACYHDPAYSAAKVLAQRAATRELIIVEGELN